MNRRSPTKVIIVLLAAIAAFLVPAFPTAAQAVFGLSSSTATVTETGHAELLGTINATISSGTSAAGTLEVSIAPATLVTDETSGVTVTGTGGLAGASVANVIESLGLVVIDIPAAAGAGSTLTLTGMRISIPETDVENFNTVLSVNNNFLQAGQSGISLIADTVAGLVVDDDADVIFSIVNRTIVDDMEAFKFREGWDGAFSDKVGILGQTAPTEVIFEIDGIPANVTVTFPDTINSKTTGATLTTESGDPEEFTSSSEPQRVAYEFTDDLPSSDEEVDIFEVTPTLTLGSSVENGTALIRATLGPIGAATPSTEFPLTDLPRFDEELLPALALPGSSSTTLLHFLISNASSQSQLALGNTGSGGAQLEIRALGEDGAILDDGSAVTSQTLQGHETLVSSLDELFGDSLSSDIASVEVEVVNPNVIGTVTGTGSAGRFSTPEIKDRKKLYLPFDRALATDDPTLVINNANEDPIEVTLRVRDSLGTTIETITESIDAAATLRSPLTTLFDLEAGALPMKGYVRLTAADNFRASLVDTPDGFSEEVPGLGPFGQSRHIFPAFLFGEGWRTTLTLVSAATFSANVTVTLRDATGEVVTGTAPLVISVATDERVDLDLEALFGTGTLTLGYIDIQFQGLPLLGSPDFAGMVRIGRANFSATTALPTNPDTEFFLVPTAQSESEFTALAIFNFSSSVTEVTVEVFDSDGTNLGANTFELDPRAVDIRLVRDHVNEILDSEDRLIRVTAEGGTVEMVAYRGTMTLEEMFNIPVQAPQ